MGHSRGELRLRAGEWVEVRPIEEILKTLDEDGCLDHLPFMPEMQAFCGKRLRVVKRAHKTCDTINNTGGRRMANAVHLEGVRCDGSMHGGCEAECLIFWKEAWLQRSAARSPGRKAAVTKTVELPVAWSSSVSEALNGEEVRYRCQATEMPKATTLLPYWDIRQYIEDVTSGNVGAKQFLQGVSMASFRKLLSIGVGYRALVYVFNLIASIRRKPSFPFVWGSQTKTPTKSLGLKVGERVRIKSFEEILETLNNKNQNRGLGFDTTEMRPFCSTIQEVRKRVSRIIDERTGVMLEMKNPCIVLKGIYCTGTTPQLRVFCPRAIPSYWREIWLERVGDEESQKDKASNEKLSRVNGREECG